MLEYLENENVTCGKIMRHEISGDARETRIWTYRNDLGEEFLAGDKWSCQRKAKHDLSRCRVDLVVEYTARGTVHKFEYSDMFQQENMNDILQKLKTAKHREDYYEKLYKKVCEENRELKTKLATIAKFSGGIDEQGRSAEED